MRRLHVGVIALWSICAAAWVVHVLNDSRGDISYWNSYRSNISGLRAEYKAAHDAAKARIAGQQEQLEKKVRQAMDAERSTAINRGIRPDSADILSRLEGDRIRREAAEATPRGFYGYLDLSTYVPPEVPPPPDMFWVSRMSGPPLIGALVLAVAFILLPRALRALVAVSRRNQIATAMTLGWVASAVFLVWFFADYMFVGDPYKVLALIFVPPMIVGATAWLAYRGAHAQS